MRTLLLAAPPTPNGDLHLGHLSGPYLALDAMARIRRQQGHRVFTACGSDEHQTYLQTKARARKETPFETADHFASNNQATLKGMQMLPDEWLRPLHDKTYQQQVLDALQSLRERGHIELRATPTPWCPSCDRALVEAFVSGGCPFCGEATSGNGCEACFIPNICSDLVSPSCNLCGGQAEMRSIERLVFPMEPWLEPIEEWLARCSMPSWLHRLADRVKENLTPVFPVTHPGDWGIEVPELGQRVFAWWEMPIGFLGFGEDGIWSDPQAELLQAYGSDNAWYFLTLLPAIMLALDREVCLPTGFLSNRFLLLDGEKFSTSRRHAIWGDEALRFLPPDFIRLSLAAVRPENEETDFTIEGMRRLVRSRVDTWTRWWSAVDQQAASMGRAYPNFQPDVRLETLWREAETHREPATFSLTAQLEVMDKLAEVGARLSGPEACFACGLWGLVAEPIMPELGARVRQAAGVSQPSPPVPGTPIGSFTDLVTDPSSGIEELVVSRQ